VKPAPFEYHRPDTAVDAVAALAHLGDGAKVLSGGQSLIPLLALRLTSFEHLVDIGRLGELQGIERRNGSLWIGAGTTQAAVEHSDLVASDVPLVAHATRFIGHFQIRNRGTVGGSLAHADPAAEYPAVALALDATFDVLSVRGSRTVPADRFFDGLWTTALEADELLTGVSFPVWSGRCGFAVRELARRPGDFAIAGAVVALELDGDDRVSRCGIGLIGMGSTPVRASGAEAVAVGAAVADLAADEIGRAAVADLTSVPDDLHGSATYRARMGATMVARAWADATKEALSV
jgi:carbon-monoxide dehydrogenase medium subunit